MRCLSRMPRSFQSSNCRQPRPLVRDFCVCVMLFPVGVWAYSLWGFDVAIDNRMRQQGMVMQSSRDYSMLPEANGGPSYVVSPLYDPSKSSPIVCSDGRSVTYENVVDGSDINATLGYLTTDALKYGTVCQGVYGHSVPAYSGNINSDDWRLNFDKGDILQFPTTLNTSIIAKRNFRFGEFSTNIDIESLYDAVLSNDASFERSALTNVGKDQVARYVNFNGYATLKTQVLGNRGLNIIAGSQQIIWGEPSFLPGGISWFNPIDVPRFNGSILWRMGSSLF